MTDAQAALLRKWGRGDLGAGLRWLVDSAALLVLKRGELDEVLSSQDKATVPPST